MYLETIFARAGAKAAAFFGGRFLHSVQQRRIAENIPGLLPESTKIETIRTLPASALAQYQAFLDSPQFDYLAIQVMAWRLSECFG
jgi:hypothetical protein